MSYEQLVDILKTQITLKGYESFQDRALLAVVELCKPSKWDGDDARYNKLAIIETIERELKKI